MSMHQHVLDIHENLFHITNYETYYVHFIMFVTKFELKSY